MATIESNCVLAIGRAYDGADDNFIAHAAPFMHNGFIAPYPSIGYIDKFVLLCSSLNVYRDV